MRYIPMVKFLILVFCSVIIVACLPNKENANEQKIENNKDAFTIEKTTKDSVEPIGLDAINVLKGKIRDSVQMRRTFQLQANAMNLAFKTENWSNYIAFMLPALVKKLGGASAMKSSLVKDRNQNKLILEYVKSGPIQAIQVVKDVKGKLSGWYCLMQHESSIVTNGQPQVAYGYLIGYSPNAKACYFIDITRVSDDKVYYLMPDLTQAIPTLPSR